MDYSQARPLSFLVDRFSYDEADEVANAVQDDLLRRCQEAPGQSKESLARSAYDAVLVLFGHEDMEGGADA